jgi:hypothetical protein
MTRDRTRAKEKARADPPIHDREDSEEDADGSDDPDHQTPTQPPDPTNAPVDGQDGELDSLPQGSPKGHKRSRINSAGQGAPVQVKAEKIKTLFEPLVRDADGCVFSIPSSYHLAHLPKICARFHCPRPTTHLFNLRSRRIPSGSASKHDHRSQRNREKQHSLCYRAWSQLATQRMRSQNTLTRPHSWLTQILGRASELNSFVKIGATDGYIEIELKGKIGKKNLVVRRSLTAASKGSTYSLNGQSATGREVTQKMNELNVQVGNLWYVSAPPPT